MQWDVAAEVLEERDTVADQHRQNGISNFVGEPATKAFAAYCAASDELDAGERRPEAFIHERREIA